MGIGLWLSRQRPPPGAGFRRRDQVHGSLPAGPWREIGPWVPPFTMNGLFPMVIFSNEPVVKHNVPTQPTWYEARPGWNTRHKRCNLGGDAGQLLPPGVKDIFDNTADCWPTKLGEPLDEALIGKPPPQQFAGKAATKFPSELESSPQAGLSTLFVLPSEPESRAACPGYYLLRTEPYHPIFFSSIACFAAPDAQGGLCRRHVRVCHETNLCHSGN